MRLIKPIEHEKKKSIPKGRILFVLSLVVIASFFGYAAMQRYSLGPSPSKYTDIKTPITLDTVKGAVLSVKDPSRTLSNTKSKEYVVRVGNQLIAFAQTQAATAAGQLVDTATQTVSSIVVKTVAQQVESQLEKLPAQQQKEVKNIICK